MRLSKTAFLFGEGELLGYDSYGRPIYGNPQKISFSMEIEPYSSEKASRDYGITVVSVQYRIFTKPDARLKLNEEIEYKGKVFSIQEVKDYDRHYEVLIKYERDVE